jgi:hypothetical protein
MTSDVLALRTGESGWENEMWARAFVAMVADGKPPSVPLLITPGDWACAQRAVAELLAANDVPASRGGAARKERNMEQGSVVCRSGSWDERGRVLATFNLAEDDLTEWQLHAALIPGPYAVVKWDHEPKAVIVPLADLHEVTGA